MLVGAVAAIAHGAALPLLMLYFGNLTDLFINEEVSSAIAESYTAQTGMDVNCSSVFDFTVDENVTLIGTTITMVIQNRSQLNNAECVLEDDFIDEINVVILVFVAIAVGVFIMSALQISTYQLSAERQVYKIRSNYYRAIMRQNIAWFDSNPTGELVNRLSE